jgi:hypothetical protein
VFLWVSTQLRVGLGSIILLDGLVLMFLYFRVGVGCISKLLYLGMGESGLDFLPLAGLIWRGPKKKISILNFLTHGVAQFKILHLICPVSQS